MYTLEFLPNFRSKAKKLTSRNLLLAKKLSKTFQLLQTNPLHPSLRSHKVDAKSQKDVWSSSVTGDIRIIWEYAGSRINVITLIVIGSHSGSWKVYK